MDDNLRSMNNVDVLIVVDAEGALASGDLQGNVYMIDTNKHVGSSSEGMAELYTACKDGQIIVWNVAPVSPSSDVEITQFTGQMVNDRVCVPQQVTTPDGDYWEGRVESQGTVGTQQYSVVLTMDGKAMTFDPFLKIGA
ncbi:alpha-pore-forming tripartite toxin MakABE regulator [Sorangium sp. So ce854]|uniref:alpha-pore-forming tripartite toxin MakABE regulator n=1 Tax=Sorangium sp. So ce854 TaxID=3133322 RepID=UPI000A602867